MIQFKSILIAVHPKIADLDAIERAGRIAAQSNARVRVMHVIGDFPQDTAEWWNIRNPDKLHAQLVKERQGFLDNIAGRIRDQGVKDVSTRLAWGREFVTLSEEVVRDKHDLVVITARRRTKLARALLDCPTMDLFRYCPCSLWITQGKLSKRFKRVAAAVKNIGGEVEMTGLNAKIIDNAAAVAKSEKSELHVIHALPLYGGKGVKKSGKLKTGLLEQLDKVRSDLVQDINEHLGNGKVRLTEENTHVLTGPPSTVIPEFMQETGMDLVVMGTVARTGIPGLLLGNTAATILDDVDCGVLAVKPDDFSSLLQTEKEAQ